MIDDNWENFVTYWQKDYLKNSWRLIKKKKNKASVGKWIEYIKGQFKEERMPWLSNLWVDGQFL